MASFKFGIGSICLFGAGLALVLQTVPALSAPNALPSAPTIDKLIQRIAQLEERTQLLQRQVDTLQKQVHTLQRKSPSAAAREANAAPEANEDCSEPFFRDSAGVLRVRRECLTPSGYESKNACNPPFSFDISGEKRNRAECVLPLDSR
jgi:hypothetical protein